MSQSAAALIRLTTELIDFVRSICPEKDGLSSVNSEQLERLEYFETEIAVGSEDAGISIPDVECPKRGKTLGCIQLPYYDDLSGSEIMPTRSWYRTMQKVKRHAETKLQQHVNEQEMVAVGSHGGRALNESVETTESFLAKRIHKARLAIIGEFRDTRSNQGLSRRKLIEDSRENGHARQDILDAIDELLRDGYLQTVRQWREQVRQENEGLTNAEGHGIFMTSQQSIKSFGMSRLREDDLLFYEDQAAKSQQAIDDVGEESGAAESPNDKLHRWSKWLKVYEMFDERGVPTTPDEVGEFITDYNQAFANKAVKGRQEEKWPQLTPDKLASCVDYWRKKQKPTD